MKRRDDGEVLEGRGKENQMRMFRQRIKPKPKQKGKYDQERKGEERNNGKEKRTRREADEKSRPNKQERLTSHTH